MNKVFQKSKPIISLAEFLEKAYNVKSFTSSRGQRYQVLKIEDNTMEFRRLDAKSTKSDYLNLIGVYEAYKALDNFNTENFRPYVERRHSPARGLLLHLGIIA